MHKYETFQDAVYYPYWVTGLKWIEVIHTWKRCALLGTEHHLVPVREVLCLGLKCALQAAPFRAGMRYTYS